MYSIHYEFTLSHHVPDLATYLDQERETLYPKFAYIALTPVQCQYDFHRHTLSIQYPVILTEQERERLREIVYTITKHFMVDITLETIQQH